MRDDRIKQQIEFLKDQLKFLESLLIPIAGAAAGVMFSDEYKWLPVDVSYVIVSFLFFGIVCITIAREYIIDNIRSLINQL